MGCCQFSKQVELSYFGSFWRFGVFVEDIFPVFSGFAVFFAAGFTGGFAGVAFRDAYPELVLTHLPECGIRVEGSLPFRAVKTGFDLIDDRFEVRWDGSAKADERCWRTCEDWLNSLSFLDGLNAYSPLDLPRPPSKRVPSQNTRRISSATAPGSSSSFFRCGIHDTRRRTS